MLKKFFKLILISIISILLISCEKNVLDPDICYLQILVTKETYLPVNIKTIINTTIGSITSADKDENGNYINTFELHTPETIEIYKNYDVLIHTEKLWSFQSGKVIQIKIE